MTWYGLKLEKETYFPRSVTFYVAEKDILAESPPKPYRCHYSYEQLYRLPSVTRQAMVQTKSSDGLSQHYKLYRVFGMTVCWLEITMMGENWQSISTRFLGPFKVI